MPLRLPLRGNLLLPGSLHLRRSLYRELQTVSRAFVNGNGTIERLSPSSSSTSKVCLMTFEQRSRDRFNILAPYALLLSTYYYTMLTSSNRKRKSSSRALSLMWSRPALFLQNLPRQVSRMVIAPLRMTLTILH